MDIHKPKPIHNWREFLKEYAIIVLGVLTALFRSRLWKTGGSTASTMKRAKRCLTNCLAI
jgi:hypothetical protein